MTINGYEIRRGLRREKEGINSNDLTVVLTYLRKKKRKKKEKKKEKKGERSERSCATRRNEYFFENYSYISRRNRTGKGTCRNPRRLNECWCARGCAEGNGSGPGV